eukprot:5181039-Prymnesium_polylepis.1
MAVAEEVEEAEEAEVAAVEAVGAAVEAAGLEAAVPQATGQAVAGQAHPLPGRRWRQARPRTLPTSGWRATGQGGRMTGQEEPRSPPTYVRPIGRWRPHWR